MSAVVIATLVVIGLLVSALAAFLIWVVGILRSIDRSLGEVTSSVQGVAKRTAPINPGLADVNGNLRAVADALESLAAKAMNTTPPAKAS
jgi:uncharacterized protein YoxC